MTCVVISQPMYFPWIGIFEQIRLADAYVHYDDVQFSKGSFTNRVQIKTASGSKWLTLPLEGLRLGQRIMDVTVRGRKDWRVSHVDQLSHAYAEARFRDEMLALVEDTYAHCSDDLAEIGITSIERVCTYFDIAPKAGFHRSSALDIGGDSWQRVLQVVRRFGGDRYVTGHGARHYLDHEAFEREGVSVEYLDYQKHEYTQLHGAFTPFVSILDLIANMGRAGGDLIRSEAVDWRRFLAAQ